MRLEWPSLDDCGITSSLLRLLRINAPTAPSAIAGTSRRMDRSCAAISIFLINQAHRTYDAEEHNEAGKREIDKTGGRFQPIHNFNCPRPIQKDADDPKRNERKNDRHGPLNSVIKTIKDEFLSHGVAPSRGIGSISLDYDAFRSLNGMAQPYQIDQAALDSFTNIPLPSIVRYRARNAGGPVNTRKGIQLPAMAPIFGCRICVGVCPVQASWTNARRLHGAVRRFSV